PRQGIVATLLDDRVHRVSEVDTGGPGLGAEAVRLALAGVLHEVARHLVRAGLAEERDDRQVHVLVLDVRATLLDELLVVALDRAVPDVDAGDALELGLLAERDGRAE